MACLEAPGLVIEKNRLRQIGGAFLGIIGNADHSFGYHLCQPPNGDYSLVGAANTPVGFYACAIDIGMTGWSASRQWLAWLITEIREDRITGIAEVIGSFDGYAVRYWSDDSGWQQTGVPYDGDGHDTWTHVAIYRSTAGEDHRILAGWAATGFTSGGVVMSDYSPLGAPNAIKIHGVVRGDSILLADVWGQEMSGTSPYDGTSASYRTAQLNRIEAAIAALHTRLTTLPAPVIDTEALIAALRPVIGAAVAAELARRLQE